MHYCEYKKTITGNKVIYYCVKCGDQFDRHVYNVNGETMEFQDETTVETLERKIWHMQASLREWQEILEFAKVSLIPATQEEIVNHLSDDDSE